MYNYLYYIYNHCFMLQLFPKLYNYNVYFLGQINEFVCLSAQLLSSMEMCSSTYSKTV